jgi:nucleoid-associated protein EbfC
MMKGQFAGLMKQAQQMQEEAQKMQETLAQIEVEGQAGAGLVKVIITCRYEARRLTIDPSIFEEDRDMLEDLIIAAFNDAVRKAGQKVEEKMQHISSALSLPSGLKLPF